MTLTLGQVDFKDLVKAKKKGRKMTEDELKKRLPTLLGVSEKEAWSYIDKLSDDVLYVLKRFAKEAYREYKKDPPKYLKVLTFIPSRGISIAAALYYQEYIKLLWEKEVFKTKEHEKVFIDAVATGISSHIRNILEEED